MFFSPEAMIFEAMIFSSFSEACSYFTFPVLSSFPPSPELYIKALLPSMRFPELFFWVLDIFLVYNVVFL